MRTFADLLSEHIARAGISDSELARTLQVRRQTIFRWKQGLVEKPRYREDILRLAERLRLTPGERDELLLAAGFPPETAVAVPPPLPAGLDAPEALLPVPPLPGVPTDETRAPFIRLAARGSRPKIALAVVLVALAIITGVALYWNLPRDTRYPIASSGERLIVIGHLGVDESAQVTTRRLTADSSPSPASDLSARVRTALEREMRAERLTDVHVVILPDKLVDQKAVKAVREQTQARVAIGGSLDGSDLTAVLALAPAAFRVDDLALDALVTVPSDLSLRISNEPEQIQSLALLVLSQLHADAGELDQARAELTMAISQWPIPAPATLYAFQGYISQVTRPPDLDQAVRQYSQTIELAPEGSTPFLNRGLAYIRQDNGSWQPDLTHVLTQDPNHPGARQAACWAFALAGQPEIALPHCHMAVQLDPTGRSRDARAIVYAELGRLADAAMDWKAFLNWLERQSESLRVRYGVSRSDWLQQAQAGRDPIDLSVLARLGRE